MYKQLHLQHNQRQPPAPTEDSNSTERHFRQVLEQNNVAILGDPAWDERRRQQEEEEEVRRAEREADILLDVRISSSDIGVTVLGALLWPTISSLVGSCLNHVKWVRHYFPEPFHRNILGGCLFVVVKDMANLLYRYERLKQRRSRRVRNYNEASG
ncbi:hypothetical protein BX666DRAFT_788971 [Dichotomocladium elegans]|nr:hypothetical protein BX666DRAFT_788971 [Dichotomocladium elegans]